MSIYNSVKQLFFPTRVLHQPMTEGQLKPYFRDYRQQAARIRFTAESSGKLIPFSKTTRVFAAVHHVNWEYENLVAPWRRLADVVHYDWGQTYDQNASNWVRQKRSFCNELLSRVREAHGRQPLDIFFSYLSGNWVYPDVIQEIGALGILTINFGFDDTTKFWGFKTPHGLSGNADIAPKFDVCITSQRSIDVAKYFYVGSNPLFLPPAANSDIHPNIDKQKDPVVSFIGQKTKLRKKIINQLARAGINIAVYGSGWPSGPVSRAEKETILSRSLINLGMGYIDDDERLVGFKQRDFEATLAGGLYITTYNPDLEDCFLPDREIVFYRDAADLIVKLRYYLSHPEEAVQVGMAGRGRVLRDHDWTHRFGHLLSLLKASE